MNELVRVEGLTKRFKNRRVLDDVTFSVRRGEVLGLIGPNGAGKTTLFECLSGLLAANSGTIKSQGQTLPPAQRKQTLFYLPDAILPWAEQTVKWVLSFFSRIYRREPAQTSELAEPLRLTEVMHSRIGSLSK